MILKRKAYQELLNWKMHSNGNSALLLIGARQVGKSFLAKLFGKNEYKSMITIDFADVSNEVLCIFENDAINLDAVENASANLDAFFSKLSLHYDTPLYKWESLIVFDEIQLYPKARQLLRHLVADGRYDFIATDSFLSAQTNIQDIAVLSGQEEKLELCPLSFEEFLNAIGDDFTYPYLKLCFENRKPLGQALHKRVLNDFRQYLLVGGMPQPVAEFAKEKNYETSDQVKKCILERYRDDIAESADSYSHKVSAIYDLLPDQLAKKEKKFAFSSIGKGVRFRNCKNALMWLSDWGSVNICSNAADPNAGLFPSNDHLTRKLYMADTGLLVSHAFGDKQYMDNNLYLDILLDNYFVYDGMLMENVVAQMLRSSGHDLLFYSRTDANSRQDIMDIDFLILRNGVICPVEVKPSSNRANSSLDKFRRKFESNLGTPYVLYTKDVMEKGGVVHLPIYMTGLL